jgi:hypothetical protein
VAACFPENGTVGGESARFCTILFLLARFAVEKGVMWISRVESH